MSPLREPFLVTLALILASPGCSFIYSICIYMCLAACGRSLRREEHLNKIFFLGEATDG